MLKLTCENVLFIYFCIEEAYLRTIHLNIVYIFFYFEKIVLEYEIQLNLNLKTGQNGSEI